MSRSLSYRYVTLLIGIMVAIFIGYAIWIKPLSAASEPTPKLNSLTTSPLHVFRTVFIQEF